jgi:hypothetical protein
MRVSRTPDERLIPYHDSGLKFDGRKALQNRIVAFVRGVRGERKNAVTQAQIIRWFKSTCPKFVLEQLDAVCGEGRVRVCMRSLSSGRKASGSYVYEVA